MVQISKTGCLDISKQNHALSAIVLLVVGKTYRRRPTERVMGSQRYPLRLSLLTPSGSRKSNPRCSKLQLPVERVKMNLKGPKSEFPDRSTKAKPKGRKSPAKRSTGPSKDVRELVLGRSGYRCEICGNPLGQNQFYSIHHRVPRGMGGTDRPELNLPSNLLSLCGSGTTGCHGYIESNRQEAYEKGWIVLRDHNPADAPVEISFDLPGVPAIKKFVYLSDDGWYGIEE